MNLLAIETSTIACSAALWISGEVRERYEIAPRRHAQLLLPMIEDLLAEAGLSPAQLGAVAFARGPGAFTGVRIAAGCAQGIAFGADLPVVPVSTLAVLAQGALREGRGARILAAMDARMNEIYWGAYCTGANGLISPHGEEGLYPAAKVPLPADDAWFGAGDAWAAYAAELRTRLGLRLAGWDAACYPRARDLAALGEHIYRNQGGLAPEQALPVYLRDQVATKPAPR